ncbi:MULTISPECIES: hypothetical protein [Corallincola]|uniref:Uncharacterized protein n=3 Tax=Corallincola TaxID=1775176 RepID=A0A368NMU2_9GAMM|nr:MULTISPECIES: hypothetical protein [Corallincola]RCU51728.1 hypothetical protein DU002_04455 [Corallincola holothuriorum]TAA47224.1 hypothetical protein EXY25_08270 [Corallincola spongiicola]TCI04885.1 hypothetical protein EZV61_02640 [Corallincola luteus]
MWWFETDVGKYSTRQAMKKLLHKRYRSQREYEACLAKLEEATGHPDPEGFLRQQRGSAKAKQVLAELRGEAALFQAMVNHRD